MKFYIIFSMILVFLPVADALAAAPKDLQQLLSTNNCPGCDLSGADLIGIDLTGAQLQGANLNAANLTGADLSAANLTEVSAVGANFMGANLQRSVLVKTSLVYANLAKTQMNDATLQFTDLQVANLTEADLNGAKITGSDFVGANLYGIKRAQPWQAVEGNRFQGEIRVGISSVANVTERVVEPNPGAAQTIEQSDGVQGNQNTTTNRVPVRIRGGRRRPAPAAILRPTAPATIMQPSRRPIITRRYSIPVWIGRPQRTTAGTTRYYNPQDPNLILELW
jgi:Pentapeptide repeats (8 copies)